jgi:hypothetical protein
MLDFTEFLLLKAIKTKRGLILNVLGNMKSDSKITKTMSN